VTSFLTDIPSDALHSADFLNKHLLPLPEVAPQDNDVTLTIIGQALTPYIINQVVHEFANVVKVGDVYHHPLHQAYGDSVVVLKGSLIADEEAVPLLIETLSARYHVDIGMQKHQPSLNAPGLLVLDMDSTLIAIECIDEIAKLAGLGPQVAEVTEKAMRGEIAFNESLIHRVACLKGVPVSQLQQIRDSIPIMPGAQLLIDTLKSHGWKIAIASGGFTYFADHLKQRLGLDEAVSNTLVVNEGVLTGNVSGDIVNAEVKAKTVGGLAERWAIANTQTVAMGDGANDLVMMDNSALGVACHGKPVVNQQADVAIRLGSLHSLLYFLK